MVNNTSMADMDRASWNIMVGVYPTWVAVVVAETFNAMSACMTMLIIYKNQTFHQKTFILLFALSLTDLLLAFWEQLFLLPLHFYNYYMRRSEVMAVMNCVFILFVPLSLISVLQFISLAISIDRTIAILCPLKYRNLDKKWYIYGIVSACVYSLSFNVFMFFDDFNNRPYVLYCSGRASLGVLYGQLIFVAASGFYTVTALIYITTLSLVRLGFSGLGVVTHTPKTSTEKERYLFMKNITKVFAFCSVIFFLKSTQDFLQVILQLTVAQKISIVFGSYMNTLVLSTSTIYFVSFFCFVKDYRQTVAKLLRLKLQPNQVQPA